MAPFKYVMVHSTKQKVIMLCSSSMNKVSNLIITRFPFFVYRENCTKSEKDFEKKFLPSWESHFYVAVSMFDCLDPSYEETLFVEPLIKELQVILPIMYTIFALGGKCFTNF